MNEEVSKEVDTEPKIQRIKRHIRENRKVYLATGAGFVVGAISMAIFITKKYGMTDEEMQERSLAQISAHIKALVATKPTNNITYQTISIYGNKIGRPGTPVIDTETGKRFESMTLAAEAIGATVNNVREQLHGRTDHINGHKFVLAE